MALGSFVGNNVVNRAIPHTLGKKPKLIFVLPVTTTNPGMWAEGMGGVYVLMDTGAPAYITECTSTNIYVGDTGTYLNHSGITYVFVVMG